MVVSHLTMELGLFGITGDGRSQIALQQRHIAKSAYDAHHPALLSRLSRRGQSSLQQGAISGLYVELGRKGVHHVQIAGRRSHIVCSVEQIPSLLQKRLALLGIALYLGQQSQVNENDGASL